jgi:hypothetical protein
MSSSASNRPLLAVSSGPGSRYRVGVGHVSPQRLSGAFVANTVKARAQRLGLDSDRFAGHSLRAGFVTSADAQGASIFKIMDVTTHKSVDTLRGYVRTAELFNAHAGTGGRQAPRQSIAVPSISASSVSDSLNVAMSKSAFVAIIASRKSNSIKRN